VPDRLRLADGRDHPPFRLAFLSEVDALGAAAEDDGRLQVVVQALVFVDVAERDIAPDWIGQRGAPVDRHIAAHHDVPLGPVAGLVHAEMAHENGRRVRILPGFVCQGHDAAGQPLAQQPVQLIYTLALGLFPQDVILAQWIRRGRDLQALAVAAGDGLHRVVGSDVDVGHAQRVEDADRSGAALHGRQVVVAHQQHHGHACIRQPLDAPRELPLEGGIGIAHLVRVAREHEQIDVLFDGIIDHVGQPSQEIHHAAVDARLGVHPTVVFHADVQIGGVEQLDRLHGCSSFGFRS